MGLETLMLGGSTAISVLAAVLPFLKCLCNNNKEVGVAMISKSGLTTLVNSIESLQKFKVIFLDIDEMVNAALTEEEKRKIADYTTKGDTNSIRNLLLPKYKEARTAYRKAYKKKKIFVFSHNVDLLNHMGLPSRNIVAFLPSKLLYDQIISNVDEATKTHIQTERNEILQSDYPVFSYATYQDLAQQFTTKFGLTLKM